MRNSTRVTVEGKSFMLRGEATVEHIQQVAEYVDAKIAEIRREAVAVRLDPTMAYILTALNIADDFIKAENKVAEVENELIDLENENEELRKLIRALKSGKTRKKSPTMQYNNMELSIISEVEMLEQNMTLTETMPEMETEPVLEDEYEDTYADEPYPEDEYVDEYEDDYLDDDDVAEYIEELEELEEIEIPRVIKEKAYAEPVQQYVEPRRNTTSNNRSGRRRKR